MAPKTGGINWGRSIVVFLAVSWLLWMLAWGSVEMGLFASLPTPPLPEERHHDQQHKDRSMQTKTTTWTSARGTETVSTVRNDNESEQAWCERHDAAVAAAQHNHPPV